MDPIGIAGGLNVYGYAAGDPVNFNDPFGLSADTVGIGCRAVKNLELVAQHCAIRIEDMQRKVEVYELLSVGDKNSVGHPATSDQIDKYSNWVTVDVPKGMGGSLFDETVRANARSIGAARNGNDYSWKGGRNSNRFVYDVITRSGGMVPERALANQWFAPGICGGVFLSKGAYCSEP
jgi:uncharacterized protein RhaS with RHS repeats